MGQNQGAAIRIARTGVTSAQSCAALDAMYHAREMGLDVKKKWLATLDKRTRISHGHLDNEVRELEEPFSNGLQYPGDSAGAPGEVYNCRCTMETVYPGMDSPRERKAEDGRFTGTYDEWIKTQENVEKARALSGEGFDKKQAKINLAGTRSAKDFENLEKHLNKTYGIKIDDSVKNLDFESVQNAFAGVQSVMEAFPELQGTINRLSASEKGFMACDGNTVYFNPKYFSNPELLQKAFDLNVERGKWVKNCNVGAMGAHEAGHALEQVLIDRNSSYKTQADKDNAWFASAESGRIWKTAYGNIVRRTGTYDSIETLTGRTSAYARTNASEAMAEAFADVYANKENARPLSKEIVRLVKNELGGSV